MVLKYTFRGLMAPVFTPFEKNFVLNLQPIEKYGNYLKTNGVNVCGTVGEGVSMNLEERMKIADAWIKVVKNTKQSIMVHVGGCSLTNAQHAEKLGADAILCLPDLFFRPKSELDLAHYLSLVSKAAPNTPLLYYHIPSFTGINLDMAKFLQIGRDKIPTLAGIKFTDSDLDHGIRAVTAAGSDLSVFLGADTIMSGASVLGFSCTINTTLNLWPSLCFDIFKDKENMKTAIKSQMELFEKIQAIAKHGSWVSTMKAATEIVTGIELGPPRPPLIAMSVEQKEEMKKDICF